MANASAVITIARPIEDVFAALTDVEQTHKWFPWDVEEHWTSPPPLGIGSTRHAVIRMGGRQSENDAVVTEYEPPHRAVMRGTSPDAPFDAVLAFERVGDGTRVDVTLDFAFRGALRIVGPPFAWWYARAWRNGLKQLRRLMESDQL